MLAMDVLDRIAVWVICYFPPPPNICWSDIRLEMRASTLLAKVPLQRRKSSSNGRWLDSYLV